MTYVIVRVEEITDPGMLAQYREKVPALVESFGGRYLALEPEAQAVEGEWKSVITAILEFPTRERAWEFYRSEQYQKILPLRLRSTRGALTLVRGLDEIDPR